MNEANYYKHYFRALFFTYDLHIFIVADVLAAHRFQMWGLKLAVDEVAATVFHQVGKIDEGEPFEAEGSSENILSPKKERPMVTP